MPLIDDNGKLFGAVNIIDALVVLLLVAVLITGVAIISGSGSDEPGESPESETRYATIELGEQPEYVLEDLDEGDVLETSGWDGDGTTADGTVTGIYDTATVETESNASLASGANASLADGANLTIHLEIGGVATEDDHGRERFEVDGEPILLGTALTLEGGTYVTNGTLTALERDESTTDLETTTTEAELEVRNISPAVAAELEEGLSETARGETVATIQSVETEPVTVVVESDDGELHEREHPRNEDATIAVELQTTETEAALSYQGDRLEIGSALILDFDRITVDGEVTEFE
ncbi:DUF4330 domain-containing protein [Halostagnicola bangensis]